MVKFYICFILFIPITINLWGQSQKIDSLMAKIKEGMTNPPFEFHKEAEMLDELAQSTKDDLIKGKSKNFLGISNYYSGQNALAIEYYLEALQYFEKAKDTYFIALVNNNIGAAYSERKNPDKVIQYYNESLSKFILLTDSIWISNLYNNISIQYYNKEEYLKANDYISQAIRIYKILNDSASLATALVNQSSTLSKLRQYEKAEYNIGLYLKYYKKYHDDEILSNAYATLARISITKSKLIEAEEYAAKSLDLRKKMNLRQYFPSSYLLLSEISEDRGQYADALKYYKEYKIWEDSSWIKEKDKNINELLISYDVQEKVKTINKLYTEKEYEQLKLKNIETQKMYFLLGLIFFSILALMLAYLLYMRNEKNKALNEKNKLITSMLNEKELLLREIHHRVKNNLQVVSSLLNLQSNYITDDVALEAINEGKNRVLSMALIHQNLYTDEYLTSIETTHYFDGLLNQLFDSYNIDEEYIKLEKDIESFLIDVDTMIPLGLITNELISNALKHAFKGRSKGNIYFNVKTYDGSIVISTKDNGVGVDPSYFTSSRSFGNKMIQAFVNKLKAQLIVKNDNGTEVILSVPLNDKLLRRA